MDWLAEISEQIKTAMKAKDKVSLEALRSVKKEMLEVKTSKGNNGELVEDQAMAVLIKLVKQRNDSATIFSQQGREDLAEAELQEAKVIEQFLPEKLSEEDVKEIVKNIIEETGASSMKDMGKVMGIASKKMAGKADGKLISSIVRSVLN